MAITKYASVEAILETKTLANRMSYAQNEQAGDRLVRFAAANDVVKEDGYLYVRCRAISSRVNKNNDGWPSEELAKAYKSFIGKPIFVDHNNDDPKRTRGVIVDAQLHVEDPDKTSALDPYYSTAPDNHKPPTWIELLMEVDAKTYPKLAKAIEKGEMDAVSMGANIEKSICSVCANEAATPSEYCSHVKQKGATFEITSDNGEKIRKKAYEDCYGVGFFEISNVFDPADETADSWLDQAKASRIAARAKDEGVDPDEVLAYLGLKQQGLLAKAAKTQTPLSEYLVDGLSDWRKESLDMLPQSLQYPESPEGRDQIVELMRQIVAASDAGNVELEAQLKAQLEQLLNRTAAREFPGDTRTLTFLPEGAEPGQEDMITVHADDLVAAIQDLVSRGASNILIAGERDDVPGDMTLPSNWASIPKGAPYPENSYKNAPDHTPKKQKKWPKEVNAIYNACMREGNGKGDTKEEKESSCAAIAWAQHNKGTKSKDSRVSFTKIAIPAEQFVAPLNQKTQEGDRDYVPQSEMTTAPEHVDTLRSETRCPICRAADMETSPDGVMQCPTCGHVQEPAPLNNPDLGLARDVDLRQDSTDVRSPEGDPQVPASNPLDSVEFSPMQTSPSVAARKDSTTNEGISEMFKLKLRTSNKEEAVAAMRGAVKVARAELKLGANGIHRGTYEAAEKGNLKVRVSYPAVKDDENYVEVPGENGVFNLFFAQESASELKVPISEVPIVVEADTQEAVDAFVDILANTPAPERQRRRAATGEKKPILPSTAKPSDEPKDITVVKDEHAPRETKTVTVTEDVVEMDGKRFHLVEVSDDESKDEEKSEPVDTSKAKDLADEVADDSAGEDKETRLLAAFKIADLAVDLGLVTSENKMAFIAELEDNNLRELVAREETMQLAKTAGLAKSITKRVPGVKRIPRLNHNVVASNNTTDDVPVEALFL